MENSVQRRNSGILTVAAGVGIMVFALLVGFTNPAPVSAGPDAGSTIDWVSVITAIAGLVLVVSGLFMLFGRKTQGNAPRN
jgi:uncharacterized membrane protein